MEAKGAGKAGPLATGGGKRLGRGLGSLIPTKPGSSHGASVLPAAPGGNDSKTRDRISSVAALSGEAGSAAAAALGTAGIEVDVPRETSTGSAQGKWTPGRDVTQTPAGGVIEIPIDAITPNQHQPRESFNDESIVQLAESIKSAGLLQPITVRAVGNPSAGRFELIAGERRLRAAQRLGWSRIPAIVRSATDRESAQLAFIENVQRDDLNPVERAFAVRSLCDEFDLTHQQVAEAVGLERVTVSNLVRLTELDGRTLDLIRTGRLSAGHARALLGVKDLSVRSLLADTAIMDEWSVRTLEREVQLAVDRAQASSVSRGTSARPIRSAHITDLESRLSRALGTPVHIQLGRKKGAGKMTIDFFSSEQFDGILGRLGVQQATHD